MEQQQKKNIFIQRSSWINGLTAECSTNWAIRARERSKTVSIRRPFGILWRSMTYLMISKKYLFIYMQFMHLTTQKVSSYHLHRNELLIQKPNTYFMTSFFLKADVSRHNYALNFEVLNKQREKRQNVKKKIHKI